MCPGDIIAYFCRNCIYDFDGFSLPHKTDSEVKSNLWSRRVPCALHGPFTRSEILLQRTTRSILPATNIKEDQLVRYLIVWGISDADSVALGAADTGLGLRSGESSMPENGREGWGHGWLERERCEGKTWQQGEVRPGEARALLKMAFVTWQQQLYMPFLFYFFR